MGRKKSRKPEPGPGTVGRARVVVLVAIVAVAVALAFATWRSTPAPETLSPPDRHDTRPSTPAAAPKPPSRAVTAPAATGEAPAELRSLLGEWVRPDGGYVLVVGDIAEDGQATVAYLNPRPIHVQRARARSEDGAVKLFVELRDRGYPGSTYTLTHDPGADQLEGIYFQAAQRASYDVVFVRR
jgi:hypothetical protein